MGTRREKKELNYMRKQTIATRTDYQRRDAYGALSMPVYHCCAFEFDTAKQMTDSFTGRSDDPEYVRVMNPTVTFFENRVKALTDAANVFAFNSGMAAITNVLLCLVKAGKNIVTSNHLFGNTVSLMRNTLAPLGVETREVDLLDLDTVAAAVDGNTACLFLEIITNPQMEVADLAALAEIAHAKGVPLIADTTLIPFTEFDASALGVDAQVVSSTKYISAGATSLGGLVIDYGTFPQINRKTRFELLFNMGYYMTPHAAYMQTVGLESLDARYKVQARAALELAKRLQGVPEIKRVNYTGLPDNPFYELSRRQFGETAGFTVFDFNRDGTSEIVYRGTEQLSILDGASLTSLSTPVTSYSGTLTEYPVVADVNGDGHAEIIVAHTNLSWDNGDPRGKITVYGSMDNNWNSARSVWNQWVYNSVCINEDLTVHFTQTHLAEIQEIFKLL